jgi:hypothetical protein
VKPSHPHSSDVLESQLCLVLLTVQVTEEAPTEALTGIVEAQLLVDAIDLLDIFCIKFEVALEILVNISTMFRMCFSFVLDLPV